MNSWHAAASCHIQQTLSVVMRPCSKSRRSTAAHLCSNTSKGSAHHIEREVLGVRDGLCGKVLLRRRRRGAQQRCLRMDRWLRRRGASSRCWETHIILLRCMAGSATADRWRWLRQLWHCCLRARRALFGVPERGYEAPEVGRRWQERRVSLGLQHVGVAVLACMGTGLEAAQRQRLRLRRHLRHAARCKVGAVEGLVPRLARTKSRCRAVVGRQHWLLRLLLVQLLHLLLAPHQLLLLLQVQQPLLVLVLWAHLAVGQQLRVQHLQVRQRQHAERLLLVLMLGATIDWGLQGCGNVEHIG